MAKAAVGEVTAIPRGMMPEEWQTRCEFVACYRLAALYGWTDMIGPHISARVPGTERPALLRQLERREGTGYRGRSRATERSEPR